MEITDFAAGLRQMATDADKLAKRHDLSEVAELRRTIYARNAQAQRDEDLIVELRRQVESMARKLDAIGRMRKRVLFGESAEGVQILVDALLLIAGDRCTTFTPPANCLSAGKTRGVRYGADAWCEGCVARDALVRAGALPGDRP